MTYIEPPALSILKHQLEQRVKAWSELGVFMPESYYTSEEMKQYKALREAGIRSKKPPKPLAAVEGNAFRTLIKECAKTTGRPFVAAHRGSCWESGMGGRTLFWELKIPNKSKYEALWAMFLPVSICKSRRPLGAGAVMPPVLHDFTSGNESWIFELRDEKMFQVWLDRVKTDPVFKKALGVLP